mgnify:CR=1 FL=1
MTPSPVPTTAELCVQREVPTKFGSYEEDYVGLTGYLVARLDPRYIDDEIPEPPWLVPIYEQTGPEKWGESGGYLEAKTPVRVLEQHLTRSYRYYTGYLEVESLVDGQLYTIDTFNFTLTDYWNCPPHIAADYSDFIALIVDDSVQPIDRNGEWAEVGPQKEVLCLSVLAGDIDETVEDGVNCLMYKEYLLGYGGVKHTFPSAALEIIY